MVHGGLGPRRPEGRKEATGGVGCAKTKCPACGAENPAEQKFCNQCAAPFKRRCAKCGYENAPTAKFCGECGSSLTSGAGASAATSSPTGLAGGVLVTPENASADALEGERKMVTALFADI